MNLLCDICSAATDPSITPLLANRQRILNEALFALGNLLTETDQTILNLVLTEDQIDDSSTICHTHWGQ